MTNRRKVLRGILGGGMVAVGLPLLDCFLNANGTALADGAPLPVCFGSWFQGLGFTPGFWEPKTLGANYEFGPQLQPLTPFKSRINVFSGLRAFLDGKPNIPHITGPQACLTGAVARGDEALPASLDSLIADAIGTKTRFRSLEVACHGNPESLSRRGGSVVNPSEPSPAALYTRIFGPQFKDPNAADFKPDPSVMVRRSILSSVAAERQNLMPQLGAADRARLDEYFTSLRELEQQLDLEMQKPAPLEACSVPAKVDDAPLGMIVEDAVANHKLFAGLLAHALACGQTRVFNVLLSSPLSNLRRAGNQKTFHMHTHEEPLDPQLGYQPNVAWFQSRTVEAFLQMLTALDGVREGDGTLLDRTLLLFSTDTGFAKLHSVENIPLMSVGAAGGRMKTGLHVAAKGDSVCRVGLTIQQALGVPVADWGTESNRTSRTIAEVIAS